MTVEHVANICKGIATAQAVIAPALMVIGHFTGAKVLRNIGAVWCGLVTLDTARTVADAIDNQVKIMVMENEALELKDKIEEERS